MVHCGHGEGQVRSWTAWPLLWCCLVFLAGIAIGSTGVPTVALIACGLFVALGLVGVVSSAQLPVLRAVIVAGLVFACGMLFGAVRTLQTPMVNAPLEVRAATATAVSDGARTATTQRLYLDLQLAPTEPKIRVRARVPSDTAIRYGEVLTVSGQLLPPRDSSSFHETGFLRAHHARGILEVEELELVGERRGNAVLRWLHDVQTYLLGRLRVIRTPERSIVSGVLLGESGALPDWLSEAFRQTGTTHMLVASGANVALLAWMVEHLLAVFGIRVRMFLTSLLLLGFVVITGGDASIVRAVFLYLVVLLAAVSGRRVHLPTLLAVVATAMAVYTPWSILYDASFQLSFAAVAGLLIFSDWIARWLPTWWLQEFLAPTLAAQVATLPILLFSFGQLSIVAPLTNLLAGPIILPIMVGGIATLIAPWSRFLPWLTEGIAKLLLGIVSVGARLPWASVTTDTHRLLWSGIALGLFVVLLVLRYRWPKEARGSGSTTTV